MLESMSSFVGLMIEVSNVIHILIILMFSKTANMASQVFLMLNHDLLVPL